MADLITVARAKQTNELNQVDTLLLQQLIPAASNAIIKYCHREFVEEVLVDEKYDGLGTPELFMKKFPVTTLTEVKIRELGGTEQDIPTSEILIYEDEGKLMFDPLANTTTIYCHFPRGLQNILVSYTAGYATVPEDIQEACVQVITNMYSYTSSTKNPALKSESLGMYSYSRDSKADQVIFTNSVKMLLSGYIDHSLA